MVTMLWFAVDNAKFAFEAPGTIMKGAHLMLLTNLEDEWLHFS